MKLASPPAVRLQVAFVCTVVLSTNVPNAVVGKGTPPPANAYTVVFGAISKPRAGHF